MSRSTFECSLNMISLFASWEYVGFRIWSKIYSLRHWISVNKNTYRHHGWCHILFLFWIQQVRFFYSFLFSIYFQPIKFVNLCAFLSVCQFNDAAALSWFTPLEYHIWWVYIEFGWIWNSTLEPHQLAYYLTNQNIWHENTFRFWAMTDVDNGQLQIVNSDNILSPNVIKSFFELKKKWRN